MGEFKDITKQKNKTNINSHCMFRNLNILVIYVLPELYLKSKESKISNSKSATLLVLIKQIYLGVYCY